MPQTLLVLDAAVCSCPSIGSSGMVWWTRTQKSVFSCLSPPLTHTQPGAISDFSQPLFPRVQACCLAFSPLHFPHSLPSFSCSLVFEIGALQIDYMVEDGLELLVLFMFQVLGSQAFTHNMPGYFNFSGSVSQYVAQANPELTVILCL